jgi:hypothetical protein
MDSAVPPSVSFGFKYTNNEALRAHRAELPADLNRKFDPIDGMDANVTFRLEQLRA